MSTLSLRTPTRPAEGAPERAEEVLAGLYERHADQILRYCRRRLPTQQQAEDAVQDTFVCAFRALQRGTVPVSEVAWLYKIAERVCVGVYRSNARRSEVELSDSDAVSDPRVADTRDALFGLGDALNEIPVNQRRAFVLRELRGLSYAEIAATLGTTVASVETLIYRARRGVARGLEAGAGVRGRIGAALNLGPVLSALRTWIREASVAKAATVATVALVAGLPAVGVRPKPLFPAPLSPSGSKVDKTPARARTLRGGASVTKTPVAPTKNASVPVAEREHAPANPDQKSPSTPSEPQPADLAAGGGASSPRPETPLPVPPPPLPELPVQVQVPDLPVELPETPDLPVPVPPVPPAPQLPSLPVTVPDPQTLLPPPPLP